MTDAHLDRAEDLFSEALYYRLSSDAERARWRMEDIPWNSIKSDRISPALIAFVKQVAGSELTTFSASRKFLHEFADDVDFTQWISVWFYEETRHPHVLVRWLHHFGETIDSNFMLRGRLTPPFMKERIGTLVTNVISEMIASAGYMNLARTTREPVLSVIARNLGADEARHASGFYSYARRLLDQSKDPNFERLTAVKVLYLWLRDSGEVGHPVNQFHQRHHLERDDDGSLAGISPLDLSPAKTRACKMIGNLLDLPISSIDDLTPLIKELSNKVHRSDEGPPGAR